MRYVMACGGMLLATVAAASEPPKTPREFRGVWVATVSNIDWPSKKGLSTKEQQAELSAILDKAAALNLNVVMFQVRPMADALYASSLEPWSEFISGQLGQAPEPLYDPLAFAIREAHARGLELHAWFNPYRARHPSAKSTAPADHITKRRPDLARPYGTHHWMNPTHPEVQQQSLKVILDVVRRYDVDGVHIDDYFYPYKERDAAGKIIPFPDDDTWEAYRNSGGTLSRDDWRREAVNRFVERMYFAVKAAKPWVKVGISPFGIWRPGHPPGITGLDQYTELYADAKLWLNEGWCDYYSPQLYWPIAQEKQSYPKLLAWWSQENRHERHLCPGNYTSRVTGVAKGWPATEVVEQVRLTRKLGAQGNVHFSMKALLRNSGGVADALATVYRDKALPPPVTWTNLAPPAPPEAAWKKRGPQEILHLSHERPISIRSYVVRSRQAQRWTLAIQPTDANGAAELAFGTRPDQVIVTAVDRLARESREVQPQP